MLIVEDFMDTEDSQIQLVTFRLGNELYGVDIMSVKEIVRIQPIRPIQCRNTVHSDGVSHLTVGQVAQAGILYNPMHSHSVPSENSIRQCLPCNL